MLALLFAADVESELVLNNLSEKEKIAIKGYSYFKGKIDIVPLIVGITGIGKINSAVATVFALENFPISKIIISGIAGAYPSSGLKIGDIVLAEKEIDADKGLLINCEESEDSFLFFDKEEFSLYVPDAFKYLKKGTFLTVSACTGNPKRARFLEKSFNAICENMEGAAIAKVANLYGISVTEIRSISNIVEDRAEFLKIEDIKAVAEKVQKFIIENIRILATAV